MDDAASAEFFAVRIHFKLYIEVTERDLWSVRWHILMRKKCHPFHVLCRKYKTRECRLCPNKILTYERVRQVPSGDKLLLAFGGSTAFSSDEVARSVKQQRIYTGDSHPVVYTLEIAPSGP